MLLRGKRTELTCLYIITLYSINLTLASSSDFSIIIHIYSAQPVPFRSIPFLPILRSLIGLSFISVFNFIPIHHTLLIMSCLLLSSVYVSLYWQNVLLFQNYHSRGILNYMRGRPDKAVSDLKVCDVILRKVGEWIERCCWWETL